MPVELLRLLPHEHRDSEQDFVVAVKRSLKRAKKDDVDVSMLRFQVEPLHYGAKIGDQFEIQNLKSNPSIDVIADHCNKTIEFGFSEAGAALPDSLQGGGIGSYVLSEMIRWVKQQFPQYQIVPIKISSVEAEGTGKEERLIRFFSQHGFAIVSKSAKGKFAAGKTVEHLKSHVNDRKIEELDPVRWGNQWVDHHVALSNQLQEASADARLYKQQVQQIQEARSGRNPFWGGLLTGVVTGLVLGLVIAL